MRRELNVTKEQIPSQIKQFVFEYCDPIFEGSYHTSNLGLQLRFRMPRVGYLSTDLHKWLFPKRELYPEAIALHVVVHAHPNNPKGFTLASPNFKEVVHEILRDLPEPWEMTQFIWHSTVDPYAPHDKDKGALFFTLRRYTFADLVW